MRTLVFIWVGVLGASLTYGQDLQKVLVKSFNLDAINQMKVDLQGKYEIIAWNNDYLKVHIELETSGLNDTSLRNLMRSGRYTLLLEDENGQAILKMPGMERKLPEKYKESVVYKIYKPDGLEILDDQGSLLGNAADDPSQPQ